MNTHQSITLVECPRDALQGFSRWVNTSDKIAYYQSLLKVGFHTLDCGSFVSSKAIPQMSDTAEVIKGLDLTNTPTKLLTIVANERGALEAIKHKKISYLGYPFSISENFQVRNTRKTISESLTILKRISNIASNHNKEMVVYLSMGFGNPYGDPWNTDIITEWVSKMLVMGISIISISDTIGTAIPSDIIKLYSTIIPCYPAITFGAHFHTHPDFWYEKVNAAFSAGCLRFDGTIKGMGGCPMAQDKLVGNMPSEKLISFFTSRKLLPKNLDLFSFESSYNFSQKILTQ